ncbi:MAG: histone family protein nucleoid-structuring protein H-NS [Rubrivivax sp. SCN 71-131]|jgi:DNA-binding protein H-NS|nr:MAG: histone family protein nucleoid-structuring protein H-NS [Rubrivivax sp. SCN 71-131]
MANRLNDLLAKKAELEKQILEVQREERASAIGQVKSLMAQHGLTLADLGTRGPAGTPKARGSTKKVPPKYRDPATGQTWSGRGLQPTWLRQALAGSAKLSDFLI